MDDLDEGKSSDLGMYGRYTYISSWTDDSRENIPLWAMYTSDMQGVRIKMKKNIFDTEILKKGEDNNKEDIVYSKGLINIQKRNNITFNPPYTAQLYKVEYTDEESKLYPYLLKKNSQNEVEISLENWGKYKRSAWEFQKEWRYKIIAFPFSKEQMIEILKMQAAQQRADLFINILKDENTKTLKHIDLEISDAAFSNMEILCGPKISAGQEVIVKSLVEKYNPKAKLLKSSLKIR